MKLLYKQDIRKATNLTKPQSIIAYFNGQMGGKSTKHQYKTGHSVLPKYFSKGRVINTYEKHEINASLKEMEAIFYKEVKEGKDKGLEPDKAILIRAIRKAQGLDPVTPKNVFLLDYIDSFIKQMDLMENSKGTLGLEYNTQQNYNTLKSILEDYEEHLTSKGINRLTLQHTKKENITSLLEHLKNERDYSISYIGKIISNLKAVINHAVDNEISVSPALLGIKAFKKRGTSKEDIVYLTEEEVEIITAPNPELTESLDNVRKIAIIQLETGQRLVDILGKKSNGKYTHPPLSIEAFTENEDSSYTARFRQEKTNALVNVPILNERAVEVVRNGLYRVISRDKYIKYIKNLGKAQGITQVIKAKKKIKTDKGARVKEVELPKNHFIGSHTFRRTKITNLYKNGVAEYYILQISGHTKSSLLHDYIGFNPSEKRRAEDLSKVIKDSMSKGTAL